MNPAADAVVPVEAFARLATAVVLTDLSGRITFWNDAAETLFGALGPRAQGCCRAERTGFPWWPAPHTDRAAIVRSGRVWSGELSAGRRDLSDGADGVDRADGADGVDGADRADGTDIVASVLQAGLFSPAGELTGVVHVVTGVTGCGGACCEQPREDEPFRTIVQAADLGLGLVDVDGTIRYANPRLAELTGRPANTLAGMSVLRLLDPPGQQAVLAAVARRRAGVADGYHVECRRFDGELKCLHVLGAPVQAFDGRVTGSVVVVADETDQRRAEAELTRLALHDPLTGLPNRATLNDRLTQALARRRRANTVLAVLFADLDRFKTVNDRLGHAVGDEVLRGVAARLAGALRPGDTVARLGGDEFIVLCEELSDPDDVVEIAQRLQAALAPPIVVHSEEILISASIGVVVAALQWPIDPAELLHEADLAMYRAKSRGCGRYEIVTGPGAAPGRDWSARIAALRDALDRDEIVVFYQPRVELPTLARTGAEALVRWRHPGRGLLGPDAFLTVADRSGLIDLLGRRVLRTACGDALAWPTSSSGRALSVSVNLSARQLFDPKIVDTVAKVLTDTALDPARLTLEMSEATVMARAEDSLRVLTDLKTLGVKLAIDDVGTGYSSLTYLKRFPLDEVMIDRSLIAGLGLDPAAAALASGVIGLAHALGLRAIAEGVETGAQRDVLVAHGCDYAQGFLWSPAVPAESLTRR